MPEEPRDFQLLHSGEGVSKEDEPNVNVALETDGTFFAMAAYGSFDVKVWGAIAQGQIRFERLEVVGSDITAGTLDSVRVGKIRAEVARRIRAKSPKGKVWVEPTDSGFRFRRSGVHAVEGARAALASKTGHRGRPPLAPDFLRGVAERYLEHYEQYGQRVIKHLTETYRADADQPDDLSRNTVSWWKGRAVEDGWLTSAGTPGRAGAEPGPLLEEAWKKEGREQ